MPELKIAVALSDVALPLREGVTLAAQAGARAVEIDARGECAPGQWTETGLRQFRKLLGDLNLRVSAVRFRTRRGYYARDELDARIAATKRALELAHALGADLVSNGVGRVPHDVASPDWQLLVEVLTDLGLHGHRTGAWLAAETALESGADLARLLAALPEGMLRVDLNVGHLILNGHSPLEAVAALGPHIALVHATDARPDPIPGRGDHVALGEGDADYPALLGALAEHDYRGYFTVSPPPREGSPAGLRRAIDYLKRL